MISITEKAAEKVQEIASAEELHGQGLRLRVIGGGMTLQIRKPEDLGTMATWLSCYVCGSKP